MSDKSRMNALGLSGSHKPAGGKVDLVTKVDLGAKAAPLKPSSNPGAMTSPSAQGPERPKAKASKTAKVVVPKG